MGIVSVKDCQFFLERFNHLDKDKTGTLDAKDLSRMTDEVNEFQKTHKGKMKRLASFRVAKSGSPLANTPEGPAASTSGEERGLVPESRVALTSDGSML
jgi:hypothetical protein